MRILFTLLILNFYCVISKAQNLVLNPGLENYITCPGFGQFNNTFIDNWDKPSYGSTDYYNYGCPGIIPAQQVPHSGDAYAGILGYNYGQEYREYLTGTLSAPLIPGATYYCEFYVSLNDGYIQAIKELGAYFSATSPGPYLNTLHIPLTPQIENVVNLLDDTSSWMRISGYFLASGGEEYITIGNFHNDTSTTIVQVGSVGSFGSYYFVDDVWVSLAEGTGIPVFEKEDIKIYPNPVAATIGISISENIKCTFSVYSSLGEKVVDLKNPLTVNHATIDVHALHSGIYFLEVKTEDKVFRKKFIKE
jgi:OOP family OmpA-OmpF porin